MDMMLMPPQRLEQFQESLVHRALVLVPTDADVREGAVENWEWRSPYDQLSSVPDERGLRGIMHEVKTGRINVKHETLYCFDNCLNRAYDVAMFLVRQAAGVLPAAEFPKLQLGLGELFTNAIEHGNLEITGEMKNRTIKDFGDYFGLIHERMSDPRLSQRRVWIKVIIGKSACEWVIEDEGPGFDWRVLPRELNDESLTRCHGRGIIMSRMHFDEISFSGKGNQVRAKKLVRKAPPRGFGQS